MNNIKVLLIGYGSMGKKHARNLVELGITPYIVTNYPDDLNAIFLKDITKIKNENINYCIISSPTARHLNDLRKCLALTKYPEKILIEKSLECLYSKGEEIKNIAKESGTSIFVAYNLRFLEACNIVNKFINEQKKSIKIVEVIAGQNLMDWRPFLDYTQSYSANREKGGGVDLDLSHEIDYVVWLFGNDFKDKIIYRNKISSLEITSPDIFKLILDYNTFIVDITLDYIRRPKERYIKIICENGKSLYYDFIANTLGIDEKKITLNDDLNQSHKKMLKTFLDIDEENINKLCTIEEGLNILKILDM